MVKIGIRERISMLTRESDSGSEIEELHSDEDVIDDSPPYLQQESGDSERDPEEEQANRGIDFLPELRVKKLRST